MRTVMFMRIQKSMRARIRPEVLTERHAHPASVIDGVM